MIMRTTRIKWGTLICMAIVSLSNLSCASSGSDKYIGIQLWSVRDAMNADPQGTIRQLGEMGYSFVEAAGYSDGKFYGMEPEEFLKLVNDNGMDFLSSHTGHDVPNESNFQEVMAWWDKCIEAHARAGVSFIVQPWMGARGFENLQGLKEYCDYFNTVGAKCNEKGIRFGFHNHAQEFMDLEGQTIFDFMLENTDPAKVMFQMDIYWVVEGGKDPVDYITRYPGRFELWHVKDEAEVGASGNIDFQRIFEKADVSGMKYIIVEVENYNYEPLVSVQKSLEFLMNAHYVK